jgi:organic hydroperoxide reductase OsmC/OhrA
MHPYPHQYEASAVSLNTGRVTVSSPQLPDLETAGPPQFDGPGGVWSPETLLCASLADCFILTFHALARAKRFEWRRLECRVDGVLERIERVAQFTGYTTTARLVVPAGASIDAARDLLERSEHGCLIANSMRGERALVAEVVVEEAAETAV